MTYIAFLRGINVGGQKLIKMQELVKVLTTAGFQKVRTFIASGNVIFESTSTNVEALTKKVERALQKGLGHEIPVVLRTQPQLEAIVARDHFQKFADLDDVGRFVVLLKKEPQRKLKLPHISLTENLEVFEIADGAAFILARRKKTGWFGYPNNFIEKELEVPATTRNWTSLQKLVAVCKVSKSSKKGKAK